MSEIIYFFIFMIMSSFASSSSNDTLVTSESLNFSRTLISAGQKYEAGFFTPHGANLDNIYFGIWYYKLPGDRTVVWVANRDTPATNSSVVVLKFGNNGGGQIVITEQGVVIWFSNKSSDVVISTVLQLLDTGNLVIREANNNVDVYIWQSFDYPTDTLLPNQKLGWTKKTGLDRHLISWKSTSDPASGSYSYTLVRTGNPEIFLKDRTQTIFRTGPFMGQGLSGVRAMDPSTGINFTLSNTPGVEVYYTFSVIDPSIRSRFVMGSDGVTYRYVWTDSQRWSAFWYYPGESCDKYMACGPYGVCDDSKKFHCVCPQGFVPRDSSAVSLRDGSHGCRRRTRLECGTDGFVGMRKMKMPMSGAATVDKGRGWRSARRHARRIAIARRMRMHK